jgi:hypothetical protein
MNHQMITIGRSKNLGSLPFLLLSIAGILTAFFDWSTVLVIIQFVCMVVMGIVFTINGKYFYFAKLDYRKSLSYFFIYGIFIAVHSVFVADSYAQWSYLVNVFLPFLMLPCFVVLGSDLELLTKALKTLLQITLPASLFFLINGPSDKLSNTVYIAYVSSICLFIILLPMLKIKWKLLVVLISIISFTWDMDNRSNMLNIFVSYGLLSLYIILKDNITSAVFKKILTLIKSFLLFLPILLLLLGAMGIFNVFEYFEGNAKVKVIALSDESGRYLVTDSRTGIYEDAFNNLQEKNDWLFGSSATVMIATQLVLSNQDYESGRIGGSESGFLGLLTFGGIVYASLFFFLCYQSAKLAIMKSNNTIIKLIGVFVAYKWFFSFIELPLMMNFSWIVLFLAMGMTFNRELREMSDKEITEYFGRL